MILIPLSAEYEFKLAIITAYMNAYHEYGSKCSWHRENTPHSSEAKSKKKNLGAKFKLNMSIFKIL